MQQYDFRGSEDNLGICQLHHSNLYMCNCVYAARVQAHTVKRGSALQAGGVRPRVSRAGATRAEETILRAKNG